MHAKLRRALSRLSGTDAILMQSIVDEELAQGLYAAARAGFEPATLRTEGTDPTTEPPRLVSLGKRTSFHASMWKWRFIVRENWN